MTTLGFKFFLVFQKYHNKQNLAASFAEKELVFQEDLDCFKS